MKFIIEDIWFGFEPHYELLYRSNEHGKNPPDFHVKCDRKWLTITFIETVAGHRFGDYIDPEWDCQGYKRNVKKLFFFYRQKAEI